MNKKSLLLGAVALSAGVLLYTNVGTAYAQEATERPSMVERITERFNLNQDEVQQVFDEAKEERKEMRAQKMEEKLDEAIANGDLTQDQKEALLAKYEEMKAKKEALKDLDPEERREAFQDLRDEMKEWAEENDISLPHVHKGHHGKHGHRGGFGK